MIRNKVMVKMFVLVSQWKPKERGKTYVMISFGKQRGIGYLP